MPPITQASLSSLVLPFVRVFKIRSSFVEMVRITRGKSALTDTEEKRFNVISCRRGDGSQAGFIDYGYGVGVDAIV